MNLNDDITKWMNKLIDSSLRNNKFLNLSIKPKKSQMKIIYPEFDDFLAVLKNSQKESFPFENYEICKEFSNDDSRKNKNFSHSIQDIENKNSIKKNYIYSEFGGDDFLDSVKKINKDSKIFKEEFSIDILYLSFGLLK